MHQTRLADRLVQRVTPPAKGPLAALVNREWLVTNGLGGYASSTLANVPTRRYHGLLVAALPNPLGRVLMLSQLAERITLPDGTGIRLDGEEFSGMELDVPGAAHLTEFRLEAGVPVWRYSFGEITLERRLMMVHGQNTTHIRYRLEAGGSVGLELRPAVH